MSRSCTGFRKSLILAYQAISRMVVHYLSSTFLKTCRIWTQRRFLLPKCPGTREAQYRMDEGNSYCIGMLNLSPWSIETRLRIGISSKMYDASEATSICSASDGRCKLKLKFSFPFSQYFVLTTPTGDVRVILANLSQNSCFLFYLEEPTVSD